MWLTDLTSLFASHLLWCICIKSWRHKKHVYSGILLAMRNLQTEREMRSIKSIIFHAFLMTAVIRCILENYFMCVVWKWVHLILLFFSSIFCTNFFFFFFWRNYKQFFAFKRNTRILFIYLFIENTFPKCSTFTLKQTKI